MKTKLPSFIVTLATFFILQGVNLGVTKAITAPVRVGGIDERPATSARTRSSAARSGDRTTSASRCMWWIVDHDRRDLGARAHARRATGSSASAATRTPPATSACPVARVKIGLFMTTSFVCALTGIMVALRLASMQAGQGVGEEFQYIIAAVVGGCLLTGGFGSAIGAALGALIIGMAFIGIQFSGWNTDWRFLFLGVILLLAVLVNNYVRKRSAEGAPNSERLARRCSRCANVSKYFGNVDRPEGHHRCRVDAGEVTCVLGRQRRRQVDVHQDPLGRAPPRRGRAAGRGRGDALQLAARGEGARHRDGLPGPRDGAADVDLAQLLPRLGADEGRRARCGASTSSSRSGRCARRCARWASTCATPTSRSARCRAASARRSRSRAPSTSAPRC